MPKMRWLSATVLVVLISVNRPVSAGDRTYAYQVAWGHMTLAEAQVTYRETQDSYRLISAGETKGLLAFFFPWHGQAETFGEIKAGRRLPQRHHHKGVWEDRTRLTEVTWMGNAPPETTTSPPPDLEEVTAVPENSLSGTTDPFSLLLTTLDDVAQEGRCTGMAKLWDGRRRYDLELIDLGWEELIPDRPWGYDGRAYACSFKVERIGGFWRDNEDWRDAEENSATPPKVWAAEVSPGQWAIVRAEFHTPYGTVIGRLLPEGGLKDDS